MNEADEVAATLRDKWKAYKFMFRSMDSMDGCRVFVADYMPAGESVQVIDNVAEALYRMEKTT